ncbi:MAG: SGNH/GDSL hydrolase family protein [Oscillospiraceae bacterium]|nr:SGNH/GDSL hydrolase family protein [Oscillospiraceae bacterium]
MVRRMVLPVAAAAAFILLLAAVQRLLMPKYMDGVYEGRLVAEYYSEEKFHDVIFIGDCELYENVSPAALWEGFGIPSYIRGSAQQLVWQSYYLLEETLQYETPGVVVFSVLAMMYDTPQSEAYNRLHADGMRLSPQKLKTVGASMTEGEAWITYLLPLLRYHDRWRELSRADLAYFWGGRRVSHNGFMVRADVRPAGPMPVPPKLPDYRFGENAYAYLDKIADLCEQNGAVLLLVKAPSLYPHWYEPWDGQMAEYAAARGLEYLNLLALSDEIGLDFQTDTYNGGLHLNVWGAEKLSAYLGPFLRERYALPDRRGEDAALDARWAAKLAAYQAQKDAQRREIEEHGKIVTAFFAD